MINGPPEIVSLSVDLHENLIQVLLPAAGLQASDPALSYLLRKHRPKTLPPKSDCLVTDFYTAFVEQIFDIPKRQRKPNIQHHGQADYLRTGFEILDGGAFGHNLTLVRPLPCLKQSSSDKAQTGDPALSDL